MKKFKNSLFILLLVLIISIVNLSVNVIAEPTAKFPIPNHTKIDVGNEILNTIGYENFYLYAKRIDSEIGPGYCLEVEKDYPSGQNFEFLGKATKKVAGIIAEGYPNKAADEIGVTTDDDAYFATQMAIWCVTEGYSPNKFKSKDKELLQAIKKIYEKGMQYKDNDLDHIIMEYYYNDSIQKIAVYINNQTEGINQGVKGARSILPNESRDEISKLRESTDNEKALQESEKVVVPGLG